MILLTTNQKEKKIVNYRHLFNILIIIIPLFPAKAVVEFCSRIGIK